METHSLEKERETWHGLLWKATVQQTQLSWNLCLAIWTQIAQRFRLLFRFHTFKAEFTAAPDAHRCPYTRGHHLGQGRSPFQLIIWNQFHWNRCWWLTTEERKIFRFNASQPQVSKIWYVCWLIPWDCTTEFVLTLLHKTIFFYQNFKKKKNPFCSVKCSTYRNWK